MRDIFVVVVIFIGLIATLRYPFAGILLWTWFTLMDPHAGTWGFAQSLPLNLVIAAVTILSWLFSKERKLLHFDVTHLLQLVFFAWVSFNGLFDVNETYSWFPWNSMWKEMLLGLMISQMAANKVRMHALIWAIATSLLYWGIKGGAFTLLTGGNYHVLGPKGSAIWDANELAVATLMVLPLANYLRTQSQNLWISRGLLAGIALSTVSIVGSYSRGAFVALGGLSVVAWARSRNKLVYPLAAAAILVPILLFMPQQYFGRMDTIQTANSDASFHGRVVAWNVAWRYATEHFPIGAGLSGCELPQVFNHYFPDEPTHSAHSIYFQVLGDNGFIGLGLYLAILATLYIYSAQIRRATRGVEEYSWAFELTGMIQLSLFVFCVGGAVLSLAYYDMLFINIGLLSALRGIVARTRPMKVKFSTRSQFTFGQALPRAGE
jgi:probable O-glycosylation ligase (exosortase A-associated)